MYHPMKRTAAKGEADPGWQRITWDEAFQLMATGFQELIDKYGGECLTTFCGTSRNWCMQSAGGILYQLFGSPNGHSAYQICKGPRHVATAWQSGKAYSWMAQEDRPLVYVQWGGAQEMSNYDSSCRSTVNVTMQAEDYIIVDPRRTNLGKESKHWLPLRPGTDAAMGLAWTHVVIDNNLYDEMYVRRWTDAPFLYCADIEPTGFMGADPEMGFPFPVATRLLKESDIKEGGSPKRFMVYDELAGTDDAHPLRTNDPSGKLSYFDAETMLWEVLRVAPEEPGEGHGARAHCLLHRLQRLRPGAAAGHFRRPLRGDAERRQHPQRNHCLDGVRRPVRPVRAGNRRGHHRRAGGGN